MRKIRSAFSILLLSVVLFSCNKDSSNPDDVISAKVGASVFEAHGDHVNGLVDANPDDNTKTELAVTGQSGSSVLTVTVLDFKNTTGTFDFSTGDAIGGYYSDNGGDDALVSGTLVITTATADKVEGTFSGITTSGVAITEGSFTINL